MEIEANQFAAELLMPTELIEKDVKKLPDKVETRNGGRALAEKYKVSVKAMTISFDGEETGILS